jgi:magnesium-transporting ATPase (P-type)
MENASEIRKIEIDQDSLRYLNTARKWTMFLAILGFIGIGIIIIIGLIAGVFLSAFKTAATPTGFPEWLISVIILVFAIIYFFPVLYLFRFSKHTSNAVNSLDKEEMKKAFRNLKSYFLYCGILIIIILALYIVVLVGAGASMAFLKNLG